MFGSAAFSLRVRAIALGIALIAMSVLGVMLLTAGAGAGGTTDLAVEKTDSPDPVETGELLTYTITVEHLSGPQAGNATIEDTLPNKVNFVSATPSQGTCDRSGRKVTCELNIIGVGGSETVEIVVRPKKAGMLSNTVTVDDPATTDPNTSNDSDTETTKVNQGPTCGGKAVTVLGTEGDDEITGTEQRDVISALGGDDSVNALGGKDSLCGKSGNDVLRGKADGDLIKGGGGRDRGKGGGGDDEIKGGPKRDRLRGGSGNDLLAGGGGNDNCRGGAGSDTLKSC
jgi:uncharacterized repeat protein (TIGR01451 family)